ncbi:MAG: hypothetical protein HUU54_15830 [Ignavibacteriaceae bacterium]|nr:hypothetical protein [Ignavibacteriaceae bacterium]
MINDQSFLGNRISDSDRVSVSDGIRVSIGIGLSCFYINSVKIDFELLKFNY